MKSFIISLLILCMTFLLTFTGSHAISVMSDTLYRMAEELKEYDAIQIEAIADYWEKNRTLLYTLVDGRMLSPIESSLEEIRRAATNEDPCAFLRAANAIMQNARALREYSSFSLENIL